MMYEIGTEHAVAKVTSAYGLSRAIRAHYLVSV
jgi:hypothetical protein